MPADSWVTRLSEAAAFIRAEAVIAIYRAAADDSFYYWWDDTLSDTPLRLLRFDYASSLSMPRRYAEIGYDYATTPAEIIAAFQSHAFIRLFHDYCWYYALVAIERWWHSYAMPVLRHYAADDTSWLRHYAEIRLYYCLVLPYYRLYFITLRFSRCQLPLRPASFAELTLFRWVYFIRCRYEMPAGIAAAIFDYDIILRAASIALHDVISFIITFEADISSRCLFSCTPATMSHFLRDCWRWLFSPWWASFRRMMSLRCFAHYHFAFARLVDMSYSTQRDIAALFSRLLHWLSFSSASFASWWTYDVLLLRR